MYGVKSFSRAGAKNRKPLRGGRAVVYSGSAPVAAGQVESADPGGVPASGEDKETLLRQDLSEENLRRRSF